MAYSIPKARRSTFDHKGSLNAGPGSYEINLKDKKNDPKWTMGSKAILDLNKTQQFPGPTQYIIPSKVVESPGISFKGRYKQGSALNSTIDIPGPGQYNTLIKKDPLPSYSMAGRYKQNLKEQVPGPGEYEANKTNLLKKDPMTRFGTSSRSSLDVIKRRDDPGPGLYSQIKETVLRASPKYGFGTSQRQAISKDKLETAPGPGSYTSTNIIGKDGPSVGMGVKPQINLEEKEKLNIPGPGQYDPDAGKVLKNSPSIKMGTALRQDLGVSKNMFKPSPTIYNPTDRFTKTASSSWGFGSMKRPSIGDDKQTVPGPQYQLPQMLFKEGPKYAMGIKTQDTLGKHLAHNPGPGQYDTLEAISSKIKHEPKFSIGTGQRADISNMKEKLDTPGPTAYNTIDASNKQAAPKYGFGTSQRENSISRKLEKEIGPGSYQSRSFIGREGASISMGARTITDFEIRESRNKPGPGSYDSAEKAKSVLRSMPAYKIGTSTREQSVPKDRFNSPDPTLYNPTDVFTKTKITSIGFGTGKRRTVEDRMKEKDPGPGQYSLPPKAFGNPKFAMGVKLRDSSKLLTPGPGQYEDTAKLVEKALPAFTMASRYKESSKDLKPGPGEYKAQESTDNGPKFGFGTSQRAPEKKDSVPGPGHYKVPVKIGTHQVFAMPNQKEEFRFV